MVDTTQVIIDSIPEVAKSRDIHDLMGIYAPLAVSIFTILISIITFFWGYKIANRIANEKEDKELENIRKMFFEYEKEFLKTVKKQLSFFNDYNKEIDSYEAFNLKPFRKVVFNFDFYQSFDKSQLYKSLESYKSNNETSISYEFNKLHNFFKQNFMKLFSFHEEIVKKIAEDTRRWNEDHKIIHEFHSSLSSLNELLSDDEIKQLRINYTNFFEPFKTNKKSASKIYDEYVEPLIESLQKKLVVTQGNQKIGVIILQLQQLSLNINSFSANKKFLKEAIENFCVKAESVLSNYNSEEEKKN